MSQAMSEALEGLFDAADPSMDAWRTMMNGAAQSQPVKAELDPALYLACFTTDAGRLVLEDLYRRYVHVTRAVPGAGHDAAYYREGMAQVVFDIVDQMTQARNGD